MGIAQVDKKIPCLPDYFPKKITDFLVKMLHIDSDSRPDIKNSRYYFEYFLKNRATKKKFKTCWSTYRASLIEQKIHVTDYVFGKSANQPGPAFLKKLLI